MSMPKLKPRYQAVTPRDDPRENHPLDASEFAVHFDHIRDNRAPKIMPTPSGSSSATYMTKSLLDLSAQDPEDLRKRRCLGLGENFPDGVWKISH